MARLKQALLKSKTYIADATAAHLGKPARIYNKPGRVKGLDRLENALIMAGGHRILLTLFIPYTKINWTNKLTLKVVDILARHTLPALRLMKGKGPPLQLDAGAKIEASATAVKLTFRAPDIDTLKAWIGPRPLTLRRVRSGVFTSRSPTASTNARLLTVMGFVNGRPVAYRTFDLKR
jgi:hypothetical protein